MPQSNMPLTEGEAKKIAEQAARDQVSRFSDATEPITLLSPTVLESGGSHFFYLHEAIAIPGAETGMMMFTAFAVSCGGQCNLVYDYRPDIEKMQAYADMWGLHAQGEADQAIFAFEAFQRDYPT